MPRYRKKPIEIEAFQITEESRQNNKDWPDWLNLAWQKDHSESGALYPSEFPDSDSKDKLIINTLEGKLLVEWDDYIIQGINGEIYPCKPDIFYKTYELLSKDDLDYSRKTFL